MNLDVNQLEEALLECRPAKLDPSLFSKLVDALDQASAPVAQSDLRFEEWLGSHSPTMISNELMDRLVVVAEPVNNVVAISRPSPSKQFRTYAAAAAIALFGAAIALLAPIGKESELPLADQQVDSRIIPLEEARKFVPASYARGLCEARDEGVVWRDNTPHRVLRIVYIDMITLTNESGEKMEVEQPCVEYIVVPEKID